MLLCPVKVNAQLHNQANLDYLKNLSSKSSLTKAELDKVRATMLAINNEARLNPNYRKQQGCKTALNLPANLKPLSIHEDLNKLAQEQADYQASIKDVTHDNRNYRDFGARVDKYLKNHPKPEACAGGMYLSEYPIGWMTSETHYRPTWNLDSYNGKSIPVNVVGYGVAKNGDMWYFTAIWSYVEGAASPATTSTNNALPKTDPIATNPVSAKAATLKYQSRMKPGDKLQEGEKLVSANGRFQLRGTPDGTFVIEALPGGQVAYTFPLNDGLNSAPRMSFLSYNPDGNVVINSSQKKAYYATNGSDRAAPIILYKSDHAELTDDGRFVLVDKNGNEIWSATGKLVPKTNPSNASKGTVTNLALNKPTKQSSDMDPRYAGSGKAVDGNTDGSFKMSDTKNSITHTNDERSAWWEVDLGAVYDIEKIVIWNRQDCCWDRLQNFIVLTSSAPFVITGNSVNGDGALFGPLNPWLANIKSHTIDVNQKSRYIRITLVQGPNDRPLSLTEVQVFGK
ncbi:galactose-binding domain-containing protein [Salmonirosea aquatica]